MAEELDELGIQLDESSRVFLFLIQSKLDELVEQLDEWLGFSLIFWTLHGLDELASNLAS